MPDDSNGRFNLGSALGRLEGAVGEMRESIKRIDTGLGGIHRTVDEWRTEMIRLQEKTKTRATVAAILAIVLPSAIMIGLALLRYMGRA